MLVSRNSRLDFGVSKLYSFKSRVFFRFWLVRRCSLAFCDRSKGGLEKCEDLVETVTLDTDTIDKVILVN